MNMYSRSRRTPWLEFTLGSSRYLLRELPEGYVPTHLYPHTNGWGGLCCITPDGSSDVLFLPGNNYRFVGHLDDIEELEGQKFDAPTGCHAERFAVLKISCS